MSNSEKYVEDSAYMLPSKEFDPSLHLTPSECHHLFQTCRQARLEADDVYVCEDRLFGTKCDMLNKWFILIVILTRLSIADCHCNRYGLKRDTIPGCNPSTGQCACKTGVTGTKCDKCDKNYWNFRYLIDDPRAVGCKPCSCNRFGSLSEDCDKLTGKCRCRAGVTGLKCDQCHNTEWQLTNRGCVPIKTEQFNGNPCQHHQCHYGAICLHNGINAHCTCQLDCPKTNQSSNRICASDGTIHSSMCHFREHTCHLRKRLHVVKHCVN
ncbi:hypothetical protein BLOT_007606 [Blomia tropicalis]|nr:hypothetical protein BLOT_007606 [Blomia tropicalis]